MRVYHFLNREYGLDDIAKRRLKIATLNDLNDPFELLAAGSTDAQVRAAFRRFKDEWAKMRGLLCFSRNWKNPVQWSHYADRHRGLCLGFDVPDASVTSVQYCRRRIEPPLERLVRGAEGGPPALAAMKELLTTKYSHWRYEREVRGFTTLDERDAYSGLYFIPFSNLLILREVIVGTARISLGRSFLTH